LLSDIRAVSQQENDNEEHGFWKHRFRITVQEESTFHERKAFMLSGRRMVGIALGIVLFISATSYFIIAHTPLAKYVVPGYVAKSYHEDARRAKEMADSALIQLGIHEHYISSLKMILEGGVPSFRGVATLDSMLIEGIGLPVAGGEDMALRGRVEGEDKFALKRSGPVSGGEVGFGFPPVGGVVSDEFDLSQGHLGVDIIAPEGSMIHAVDNGTILISTYTAENGYVLVVQHSNNRLSVYKHNSSLLKDVGDIVRMGDPIATVGNSGSETTGPHLHFEWWVKGRPVNPEPWLAE
jgi:murein DD-endopeptidase MepM/ murein hydrolase activator NlpD